MLRGFSGTMRSVSEPTPSPAPKQRPFQGAGGAIARGLSAGTTALIQLTSKVFGEVRERGGSAYADFSSRPEHSRWRAYALGSYGLIVLATLVGQTYSSNKLDAYVRVQPVELPALTQIFVRNDSGKTWKHVKLQLNGIYGFESNELTPGSHILLPVNRFAVYDAAGKPSYAPKNIQPRQLAIDCDGGHFETELVK